MLTSTLGVVAFAALVLLAFGVLNPIVSLAVFVVAGLPLILLLVGRLFRHAGPQPAGMTGAPAPTSRQASYDPVEDPSAR